MLEARKRILGSEHQDTLDALLNLANVLRTKGDWAGAEPLYRQASEGRKRILGTEHADTLAAELDLTTFLRSKGNLSTAELLCRRLVQECDFGNYFALFLVR